MTNTVKFPGDDLPARPDFSTEEIIERGLAELLEGTPGEFAAALVEGELVSMRTLAEEGIVTADKGFVLTTIDGSKFHLIVARAG